MKTITLRLEDEMHKQLKIKVTQEDTTMQDKLVELIEKYLEEEGDEWDERHIPSRLPAWWKENKD